MRALMVQGTASGVGKTVLVAALCRIFSDMGISVAPFKSQNMSSYAHAGDGFEISRAQAVQAVAARCEIVPDLNPILLKPAGNQTSTVYLNGRRLRRMRASEYYREFVNGQGIRAAAAALRRLQKGHDLVILEGAGSPAEINLQRFDIANMRMAVRAGAAVLLAVDVDRGGSFASAAGTVSLVGEGHRRLIRGFVFNKFRGDIGILRPGFARLKRLTGIPVVGTVPMMRVGLPEEDSLGGGAPAQEWDRRALERGIRSVARTVKSNVDLEHIGGMLR